MAHLQRSSLRRYPLGTHQSFAAKSKRDRFLNPDPAGQHKGQFVNEILRMMTTVTARERRQDDNKSLVSDVGK